MLKKLIAAVAAGYGLVAMASAANAQAHGPRILVMAEDADRDSVPRNNRIFNQVMHAVSEELNTRGFAVYDETAASMGITKPGRIRRNDATLIDIARSISRPPVDAVVVFQIYASATQSPYSDVVRPAVRIPGRIINVRTSQKMASFDVQGLDLPALPRNCNRDCLLETVGTHARSIGRDLGAALAEKLKALRPHRQTASADYDAHDRDHDRHGQYDDGSRRHRPASDRSRGECGGMPDAFTLVFDGFRNRQITRIEEYFASFRDFCGVRPITVGASHVEYWYETHADAARLNRNLRLMLDHMGVSAQIQLSGNTIRIVQVTTR